MVHKTRIKVQVIAENGLCFDPHFELNKKNPKLSSTEQNRLKGEFIRPSRAVYETARFLVGAPFFVDRESMVIQLIRALWDVSNKEFKLEDFLKRKQGE